MSNTRTVIESIEIKQSKGQLGVLWAKQILDDSDNVISEEGHWTFFDPSTDVSETILMNNRHIAEMGYTPPTDSAWSFIQEKIVQTFTPTVIAAWQDRQSAMALQT